MQQWEYLEHVVPVEQRINACNQLGSEGWELVAVQQVVLQARNKVVTGAAESQAVPGLMLIFKRPLQPATLNGHAEPGQPLFSRE